MLRHTRRTSRITPPEPSTTPTVSSSTSFIVIALSSQPHPPARNPS